MKKNLSLIVIAMLFISISGLMAVTGSIGIRGGVSIPKADLNDNKDLNFMGGLSFELWLKENLGITLTPYMTKIGAEKVTGWPGNYYTNTYETDLLGADLSVKYRPTKKFALNFDKGILKRIAPYANAGIGILNYDVTHDFNDPNLEIVESAAGDGGTGITIPNFGAGVSFMTRWGLNLDLGFQEEWSPFTYHLDELDGFQSVHFNDAVFMPYLGLTYDFSKKVDTDKDGIIDRKDGAPKNPEDMDGYMDYDGIPDTDNDGDGILDVNDGAPNDPEDMDGYMDYDGIPDPDNDKDGILDVNDGAPNDPEDMDKFEDADGIPDKDNDKDGILDVNDKAPNDPEDIDAFEDMDGVPDPDNDKDTILDINDKAPGTDETVKNKIETKETMNGYQDEDGVPDVKPGDKPVTTKPVDKPVQPKPEVVNGTYEFEPVHFDTDSAVIKQIYYPTIDNVAKIMKENPALNLEIQGHTDNMGNAALNDRLSLRRAQSAKTYLINKGISASRITIKGYGFNNPTASNDTPEGRSLNRRIEFKLN